MRLTGRSIAFLLAVFIASLGAPSQTQGQARSSLPGNPVKLMRVAAQQNGLEGSGIQPWYIHATWQVAAWKGNPAIQGTFEEWWTAPGNYRAVYAAPHFHRTLSVTASGPSVTGDAQWPDPTLALVDPLLRSPVPSPSRIRSIQFTDQKLEIKGVRLRCAAAFESEARPPLNDNSLWFVSDYCFAGNLPAIRVEAAPNFQAYFNSVVLFQQRYLAEFIQIFRPGLPNIEIRVDAVHTTSSGSFTTPVEKPLESRRAG